MHRFQNISVTGKLAALVAVGLLGLASYAVVSLRTLESVRVGGADYSQIIENNVLLADVLPPPAYLVETHLVAHEALVAQTSGDTATVEEAIERLAQLQQDYLDRQDYWAASTLIPESTRTLILETSADPAFRYFEIVDGEFTTALRGGDPAVTASILDGPLTEAYDEHRAGVDQIVEATTASALQIETDTKDAASSSVRFLWTLLIVTALVVALVAWVVARAIRRPLEELRRSLADIADGEGDLTVRLNDDRGDEFGQVAGSFNRFIGALGETVRQIRANAGVLETEASALAAISNQSSSASTQTEDQMQQLAVLSGDVATAINEVVVATDEMQNAIDEIARSVGAAVEVAGSAVDAAGRADDIMGTLGESSSEISDVIQVITSIAEQTNLLALNATIEAARAGEAGKGFAVVAGEVKELAKATSDATGDISVRISAMQEASVKAVEALTEIRAIIEQINETQTMIASAVEEQSATTQTIKQSVHTAAASTNEIAAGIHLTADATAETAAGADSARESANRVQVTSTELQTLVGQFRT